MTVISAIAVLVGVLCVGLWIWAIASGFLKRNFFERPALAQVPWGLLDVYLIFAISYFLVPLLAMALFASQTEPSVSLNLDSQGALFAQTDGALSVPIDEQNRETASEEAAEKPVKTAEQLVRGQWIAGGSRLAAMLLSIAYLLVRCRTTASELGLGVDRLLFHVRLGFLGGLMLIPPVMLLHATLAYWFPYEHSTIDDMTSGLSLEMFAAAIFSAGIVAPIAEEFLFRGVIQGFLQKWSVNYRQPFGDLLMGSPGDARNVEARQNRSPVSMMPIFVSAAIFAVLHLNQGAAPVPLYFLAVGLGYFYWRTGSLIPGIVIHLMLNIWSLVFVAVRGAGI